MQETKPIPGCPGYEISETGLVFNKSHRWKSMRDRPLAWRWGGYKYKYARSSIQKNGKHCDEYIHRLVLMAWVGMPPTKKHQAAHQDGDPKNNHFKNLKWMLPLENSKQKIDHGTSGVGQKNAMSKISDLDAEFIIRELVNFSTKELSKKFKINTSTVCGIARGTIRFNKELSLFYSVNKTELKNRQRSNYRRQNERNNHKIKGNKNNSTIRNKTESTQS